MSVNKKQSKKKEDKEIPFFYYLFQLIMDRYTR